MFHVKQFFLLQREKRCAGGMVMGICVFQEKRFRMLGIFVVGESGQAGYFSGSVVQ